MKKWHQRVLVDIEEQFIVPVQRSRRPALWTTAHRALSLPFTLWGAARRYTAQSGGNRVSIVCVGRPKRFGHILARVTNDVEPAGDLSRYRLWSPDELAGVEADLVAVEVHRWMAASFAASGWLMIPDSVRWRGRLELVPPAVRPHSLNTDLKKIKRFGYTLEQAQAPSDWREFFEDMVLPSALRRFGEGAWIPSPGLRRAFASAGTILFVLRDGARVAAACAIRSGATLWIPLIGVRDGDPSLVHEGASSAACSLSLDWAREQGCDTVDWGRTSPFVNDGVQRFNRKWGFEPVPDPITHIVAVRVASTCSELRNAFAREPVLVHRNDELTAYAGE